MRIPKIAVMCAVYGMCAVGLLLLWGDRRKSVAVPDLSEESLPAFPASK